MAEKITPYEYEFLTNKWHHSRDSGDYFRVGCDCYEEGFIDDFGLVTPKGRKAIEEFERNE